MLVKGATGHTRSASTTSLIRSAPNYAPDRYIIWLTWRFRQHVTRTDSGLAVSTVPARLDNTLFCCLFLCRHYLKQLRYNNVIMSAMASQITGILIIYSAVCLGADQRKHQSSTSLDFARVHRWAVNSPHKGPVTRKMFSFDDAIM